MPDARTLGRRIRIVPAFILSLASAPALAQYPAGATVQQLPRGDDPAELLAQALRTLATEPNNIPALATAGHNALVLGDPNAAVGFFGRASELAPRDGRVKAGLGSALVQLEKPAEALRLFGEASALGVPDVELAEDRGLAYDLTGDNRRAQRDYATALAVHPDDDTVRRRLALSQGISGEKAAAIATLDPLIRKRDIAGWRAQTFVLAMNGDAKGASDITHIMMPQQADRMQPFLVRLASLSPADKARAVHFGEMPQGGSSYTPTQLAAANAPATYAPAPAAPPPVPKPARHKEPAVAAAPEYLPPPFVEGEAARQATKPERQTTQVAAAVPSGLAPPAREPVTPPPVVAPVSRPEPTTPPPAPVKPPEQVAVTTGTPAPDSSRFIRPPAEATSPRTPDTAVVASTPSSSPPPRAATAPTPAPLAATAFVNNTAPTTATGSPPIVTTAIPASTPAAPLAPPAVGRPREPASPPAPNPPREQAATISAPVIHEPAKPRPARGKSASAGSGFEDSPFRTKPSRPLDDDDEAATSTARAKVKSNESTAPSTQSSHSSKTTRIADADDGTSTKGKDSSSRKDKNDTSATDESGKADKKYRESASKKSGKSATESDGAAKAKKDAKSDEDESASKAHGKSGGKGSKSEDRGSGAPKVYVQVAGGANRDDMDKAWADVKKKAPDLMKGHTPSTTPLKATNRLLVGPFKSDEEAQAFVNKMAGKGLSGFTFKSAKGQKVEKVDSGK